LAKVESAGDSSGTLSDGTKIVFGRVPEQPAWKSGELSTHHSNRHWWVTTNREEHRNKVFVVRNKPAKGDNLDFGNVIATYKSDEIRI
jgi:hypothetical protein